MLLTQSLKQHYHHSVATEANKLEQPLPKLEFDLAAQLDTSVNDVGICVLLLCLIEKTCFMCFCSCNIIDDNHDIMLAAC